MAGGIKWFRMYAEAVDDGKLRLLAFEDRWHFVALLCCKAQGLLDESDALTRRKAAVKLGLDSREFEEVARRLAEVGLIDAQTLQPIAWDRRQFKSDDSKDRVRSYRERTKQDGNVTVTAGDRYGNGAVSSQETDTDTDTEKTIHAPKGARRSIPKPEGVPESTWADFLAIRKAKRCPLTSTALAGIEREAELAGISLSDALATCCARGWQGFNADWLTKPQKSQAADPWAGAI